jgi:hypothetical protein
MKLGLTAATLIAGLSLATAVAAQDSQPADPGFPSRLALAHQMIEASGGNAQAESMIRSLYSGVNKMMSSAMTSPEAAKIVTSLQAHMEQKFIAAIPAIMDQTAQIYARNLTEKELHDEISWLESDSAKSIRAKMPIIQEQVMQAETPMIRAMVPDLMQKAVDEACDESHCTASDRKLIEAMMTKLLPEQPRIATP